MNTRRLMDNMRAQLTRRIDEHFKTIIEQQYCPEHGQFAVYEGLQGNLAEDEQLHAGYRTCCEALRAQVRLALSTER